MYPRSLTVLFLGACAVFLLAWRSGIAPARTLTSIAAVDTVSPFPFPEERFREWVKEFGKRYASAEEEARARRAFAENDRKIAEHNARNRSWTLGHTAFADLTWAEFKDRYMAGGHALRHSQVEVRGVRRTQDNLTGSLDWVAKGAVTPIKNQGICGSCWAFSTTGSVEGALQIATGKLVSLSEEQLVQCDAGDMGCQGGHMSSALKWIQQYGLAAESAYPYTSGGGHTGACDPRKYHEVVEVGGVVNLDQGDEDGLGKAVQLGPVSIAIEADQDVFHLYKSGVIDSDDCGDTLDHGVLLVGYGTDAKVGKDYWKVKNSWGESWGEQGFVRMVRGKDMCGLADAASYPTGVKAGSPPVPKPNPPSSKNPHYGNPTGGCLPDEKARTLRGVNGTFCGKSCGLFSKCPTDVPSVQASVNPGCDRGVCVLKCDPGIPYHQCPEGATCKVHAHIPFDAFICTYD